MSAPSGPVLAAYDATTGATRWTDTLAPFSPASIAVSSDGATVAITGLDFSPSGNTLGTLAYDAATGTALWSKQYKGPNGSSYGSAVIFSPDSATVFVAGATREAGANNLYYVAVLAYHAAAGASVWQSTLPAFSLGTTWTDQIAVSPDGSRVFVSGTLNSPTADQNGSMATVAYSS
jgi:hypothetical protein